MIGWAVQTAVSVSVLILLVLLLRRPVARAFGARAAYALWLAPALRIAVPALPQVFEPVRNEIAQSAHYWVFTAAAEPVANASMWPILMLLWVGGAAVFLGTHLARHFTFVHRALASGRAVNVPGVCCDVVATPDVQGPVASGLVHRLILVPSDFESRFTPEQQRLALLHEELHHRRLDLWALAAALVVLSALWFNPLAHLALGAFRRDIEAACDASVIGETGPSAAPEYARTILRSAMPPVPRSLCALTSIDELKGRLKMLGTTHGPIRRSAGLVAAALLATGGLSVGVPAAAEEPAKEATGEMVKRVEVRHHGGKEVLKRAGPGDLGAMARNCPGEKFEVSSAGGSSQKEEVKFVLCTLKGHSLLTALEKAAADIEKGGEMPAERKADILAKLRAKIAELRARG